MEDFRHAEGAALVVGGSGGIGLAISRMLAARGSDVAVTFRSRPEGGDAVVEAAREWGRHASSHRLDLGAPDAAEAAARVVAEVVEGHGGIHTLVHAAGPHVPMTHLSSVDPVAMAAQLAADAAGFFAVVQPALRHLRASQGSIVAVTTAATTRFPVRDGSRRPRRRPSRRWSARWPPRRVGTASASTPSVPACSPTAWPPG